MLKIICCYRPQLFADLLLILIGKVSKVFSSLSIVLVLENLQCVWWISTQYSKFHCHKMTYGMVILEL